MSLRSRIRLGVVELQLTAGVDMLATTTGKGLGSYAALIGASSTMRKLFATMQRLEDSLVSVLLEGESGSRDVQAWRAEVPSPSAVG